MICKTPKLQARFGTHSFVQGVHLGFLVQVNRNKTKQNPNVALEVERGRCRNAFILMHQMMTRSIFLQGRIANPSFFFFISFWIPSVAADFARTVKQGKLHSLTLSMAGGTSRKPFVVAVCNAKLALLVFMDFECLSF